MMTESNAVGLLHAEMRLAGSLIMSSGDANQVPAGGGAGGRAARHFSARRHAPESRRIRLISIEREGSRRPSARGVGPGDHRHRPAHRAFRLAEAIAQATSADALAFFDAIAPIVHFDTIDMNVAWFQSRYDKVGPGGTGKDYINCPMDKAQYETLVAALVAGDKTAFREWERHALFRRLPCRSRSWRNADRKRFATAR